MTRIVVVTTGGTIASRRAPDGAQVAGVPGAELLAGVAVPAGTAVEVREALSVNSFAMDLAALDRVREVVAEALEDPRVDGVVVTHGTDTLEETALLLDLFHADRRPVVLTGAQRSADHPGSDGPQNVRDALVVAADPAACDLGVLVAFDGAVHPARGTRKTHTLASAAFSAPDAGPVGRVAGDRFVLVAAPLRPEALRAPAPPARLDLGAVRVDVVAVHPGADRVALDAVVAAGADGVVLEAMGLGNATADVAAAVREHLAAGVRVVVSTRVHAGPVLGVYGGAGGGHDLLAAGVVSSGLLRPGQARVELAAQIAVDRAAGPPGSGRAGHPPGTALADSRAAP